MWTHGQIDKSALAIDVWDKGQDVQKETKLLKHINNPKNLKVWEKLFTKKKEDEFWYSLWEWFDQVVLLHSHQKSYNQPETAEDGKNNFLKTFQNIS